LSSVKKEGQTAERQPAGETRDVKPAPVMAPGYDWRAFFASPAGQDALKHSNTQTLKRSNTQPLKQCPDFDCQAFLASQAGHDAPAASAQDAAPARVPAAPPGLIVSVKKEPGGGVSG
jgi:hypothetical protein